MAENRVLAQQIILAPLPPLNVGTHRTTDSALQNLKYVGTLSPWPDFRSSVEAMYNAQVFGRSSTDAASPCPYNEGPEFICIGSERSLRNRFQQAIGQVLGVALEAQGVDLHFADFACAGLQYDHVPDIVGLSITAQGTELRLVGEVMVPWVPEHSLSRVYGQTERLRHVFGQPILYMGDLQCAYGFISTYDETIFFRQAQLPSGEWHVEYSPVIYSTDVYESSGSQGHGSGPSVSMRQCMFYVATLASGQGPVNNQTPAAQWVVRA